MFTGDLVPCRFAHLPREFRGRVGENEKLDEHRYGWGYGHGHGDGFTLLELMLVLALLVVFAAFAWPAIDRSLRGVRLRKAAEQISTVWGNARLSAITDGVIYVFRYQPGGDQYEVEPWEAANLGLSQAAGASSTFDASGTSADSPGAAATTTPMPATVTGDNGEASGRAGGRLPHGIVFGNPFDQAPPGPLATAITPVGVAENVPDTDAWVLFYPDGTTTESNVRLGDGHELALTVSLRGVTGTSSVSPLAEVSTGP